MNAVDKEGWVVSITPSGGWVPDFIGGRSGIGLSPWMQRMQRMQSFVLEAAENSPNVVARGKQPRVTLTPSMALRDPQRWPAPGR